MKREIIIIDNKPDGNGDIINIQGVDISGLKNSDIHIDYMPVNSGVKLIEIRKAENQIIGTFEATNIDISNFNIDCFYTFLNKVEKNGYTYVEKCKLNNLCLVSPPVIKSELIDSIERENKQYASTRKWLYLQNICTGMFSFSLILTFFSINFIFSMILGVIGFFTFGAKFRKEENKLNKKYMKNLFMVILLAFTIGCNGQTPDIECYSQQKLDSIVNLYQDSLIGYMDSVETFRSQALFLSSKSDSLQLLNDSLGNELNESKNKVLIEGTGQTMIRDTANFSVYSSKLLIQDTTFYKFELQYKEKACIQLRVNDKDSLMTFWSGYSGYEDAYFRYKMPIFLTTEN